MDEAILQQIFDELFSSLEPLETQNAALLQFLKAKGIATNEELAPYLEEAGNASNVRWRAVRVRTAALISSAMKSPEPRAGVTPTQSMQLGPESPVETSKQQAQKKQVKNERVQKKEAGQTQESEPTPEASERSDN